MEPCINGQVGAVGAYFGQDVQGIVDRLLAEQLPDGVWNCEAANGSTRSSFNTTISVLEALLEHELRVGSSPEVTAGRSISSSAASSAGGRLARLSTTTGRMALVAGAATRRGPRRAGVPPDERMAEAVALVASRRVGDGRWPLEVRYPGKMPVEMDEGEGRPSRWNTLRALRVLDWFSE